MSNNYLDVIKYEGNNDTIVYKALVENFNTKTQLIVNESQEALFYKDGQALDLFISGRHSLTTDNLPFLKKVFGKIFGDKTPFACEVFFINKVSVLDVMWGTDSPIMLEDPKYHLLVGVRANGQMGFRVTDSRKFVVKVVGQLHDFAVDSVKRSIKGMVMNNVKDILAKKIIEEGVSVIDISVHLKSLSSKIQSELNIELAEYGLEATNFYLNTIFTGPEDLSKLKQVKERYLEAMTDIDIDTIREVKMGEAKAKSRAAQGYTYQEERKYDVLEGAAKNEGAAGNIMGAGMGLGMGVGLGANMGSAMANTANVITEESSNTMTCPSCKAIIKKTSKFCSECGCKIEQKKFCSECGAEVQPGKKFCSECGNKLD